MPANGYTFTRAPERCSILGTCSALARSFEAEFGASCVAVYARRHLALTDINFRDSLPAPGLGKQHGGYRQEIYMMAQYTRGPNFARDKFGFGSSGIPPRNRLISIFL
jgi:hypothetical protein